MAAERSEVTTPRPRRFLRGLALQLGLLVAVLAVFEVGLRAIDLRFLREGHRIGHSMAYNYDAEIGWLPVPNSRSLFTGLRTVTVSHNSLGLRDTEPEASRGRTILFVGDSFVWGYDVEAADRFTDRLRRELPQHRIVNAGIAGYGTDQQYLLLRRLWDRIRPDVVVLVFCVDNDRRDNSTNSRYDGYYKPYFAAGPDGVWRFQGQPVPKSRQIRFREEWIARNSWVARVLVSAYVQVRHPAIWVPDPTERLIGMIRELSVSRGAKFLVGMQHRESQLEKFLNAQDIAYASFDGAEQFQGDGNHWTTKGHGLVAERLKELLTRSGMVP